MPKENKTIKGASGLDERRSSGIQSVYLGEIESWLTTARPRLRRLAQLRGVSPDTVEDIVQETLLEAWKHLDRLHTPEGFHVWLDEICRNMCRRYARTQATEQQHVTPLLAPYQYSDTEDREAAFLMNLPDPHLPDPLKELNYQDMALLLDRALKSLSKNAREVVELCYLMELPQREAAMRLELSLTALEARLHRARHQLRQILSGPLREDAEALGLAVDQENAYGWHETRLWCTLCGQRRLMGMLLPQPDGGTNLHMQCPECEQRYGLSDVHNSNVHSKGLVRLDGLESFRPAWKRTMQGVTRRLTQALLSQEHLCPDCETPASLQVMDKLQVAQTMEGTALTSLSRHPCQFWVCWKCHQCNHGDIELFAASDLVYWSHPQTQQFMTQHPRWVSELELLTEYAGQPAIRFQMADISSAARLTVLAHRQTLHVLALF